MVEGTTLSARLQAETLEPRPYTISSNRILCGIGEPPLHHIGRQKEKVGAHLLGLDRIDLRRTGRLAERWQGECGDEGEGYGGTAHHGLSSLGVAAHYSPSGAPPQSGLSLGDLLLSPVA